MKKTTLFLMLCFLYATGALGQSIQGTWAGSFLAMGTKLDIVFNISQDEDSLSATMDSPNQGAFDIPVSKITYVDNKIHMELGAGILTYDGTVNAIGSITGSLRQSGQNFSLNLIRTGAVKAPKERPQTPKPPFPYEVKEVTFENQKAGVKLAGTLTYPSTGTDFPAIILISGSGPNDRNETIVRHKPFWVIADYLTQKGFAVLRYDKRGIGSSTGDYANATTADFASDAEAAVQFLKTQKEINPQKIGFIGHSEGGIIAPMVASADKSVNFIVLLSGSGIRGIDLLGMQAMAIGKAAGLPDQNLKDNERINRALYLIAMNGGADSLTRYRLRGELEAAPEVAKLGDSMRENYINGQIETLTSPWMRYFLALNPADYLKQVTCPVLILSGTKDLQVPADENVPAIQKALTEANNTRVTTKIFMDLNHLFQKATKGLPSEYGNIDETIDPEVLSYMANWLAKEAK